VLLNEVDWELVGALDAELKAGCVRLCKGGAVRSASPRRRGRLPCGPCSVYPCLR
jgi:hypothetical protein